MKNIIYISAIALTFFLMQSCQTEVEVPAAKGTGELILAPTVNEPASVDTRAIGENFFDIGGEIDVNITTNNNPGTQRYRYQFQADRLFRGNPPFHFSLDDSYITSLTAVWPSMTVRQQGLITDQRVLEDYRASDWLTATATVSGIMPTNAPVPLNFSRENSMLEFELVGQNTEGLDIESLILELHNDNQPVAYWAYCGDPNGHAQLILEPGTAIFSPENYLIGRVTVSQENQYTIIFPQTDLVLQPGTRYLVTLTPQGYFMDAYLFIGGWSEGENGIGIPFEQPTPDINGNFLIETPQQLIAMSYLIRHYEDGATFDWNNRTYILSPSLTITDEYAQQYRPVPRATFSGQIQQNGEAVQTLTYGAGQTLNLYDVVDNTQEEGEEENNTDNPAGDDELNDENNTEPQINR